MVLLFHQSWRQERKNNFKKYPVEVSRSLELRQDVPEISVKSQIIFKAIGTAENIEQCC